MNAAEKISCPFADAVAAVKAGDPIPPIFPCLPGAKEPATPHGFRDAACTREELEGFAAAWPGANIGFAPDAVGLCVLDIDGPDGESALAERELQYGLLPLTYEVKTPRGRHLYFRGSLPASTSKLGPKIDTRGRGSYVLAAGSIVNGSRYEEKNSIPAAPLPEWIAELFHSSYCAQRQPSLTRGEPIDANALRDALSFLDPDVPYDEWRNTVASIGAANCPEARQIAHKWSEGALDRHGRYEMAHPARYTGADAVDQVLDTMPPKPDGIGPGTVAKSAHESGWQGTFAPKVPSAEVFDAYLSTLTDEREPQSSERRIVLRGEDVQNKRTPPKWLVEGFLPEVGTAALHAPFNSFKSFTAADALLSVASGHHCFNSLGVTHTGPAIYLAGEGLAGFETLRRPAWRIARSISSDRTLPIYTVDGLPLVRSAGDVASYVNAITTLDVPPFLIVIDPVARSLAGLNENDAGDAGRYVEMVDLLAKRFRCCVLSILHEGKEGERGARGSSAFPSGFDSVWRQEADTDRCMVRLTSVKQKDASDPEPIHLQGREVALALGGKSLVFDLIAADTYRAVTRRNSTSQRTDIGAALRALEATGGTSVTTHVLAIQLAGPGAGERTIAAKERALRRAAEDIYRAYVAHQGQGRGDPTLWTFPSIEVEDADE